MQSLSLSLSLSFSEKVEKTCVAYPYQFSKLVMNDFAGELLSLVSTHGRDRDGDSDYEGDGDGDGDGDGELPPDICVRTDRHRKGKTAVGTYSSTHEF